jgi:hypothetical protein
MPTYYWVNTTPCIKECISNLISNKVIDENKCIKTFKSYIEGICPKQHSNDESNKCQIDTLGECRNNKKRIAIRINHILSYCIDINETNLLNILIKLCKDSKYDIDLNINCGNEYSLISLVIDNIDEHKRNLNETANMITLINSVAKEFNQNIIEQMNFSSTRIMRQRSMNDSDKLKLIDVMVLHGTCLKELYCCSLYWDNCKFVTHHLLENHYDKIDLDWTYSALENAKYFGKYDVTYNFSKMNGLIRKISKNK